MAIFTPTLASYLRTAFRFGNYISGHPYRWNDKLKRVEMGSTTRLQVWKVHMLTVILHATFMLVRCTQVITSKESTKAQRVFMRFMVAYSLLCIAVHAGVILKRREILTLTNQYLDFMEEIKRKFDNGKGKVPLVTTFVQLTMAGVYYSILGIYALLMAAAWIRPNSKEQLSSLLAEAHGAPFLVRIFFVAFSTYVTGVYVCSIFVLIFTCLGCAPALLAAPNELGDDTFVVTLPSFRDPERKLRMYGVIRILGRIFNDIYCSMVIPMAKLLLVAFVVFCSYGGIRMHGIIALMLGTLGLFSFTFLAVIFTFIAEAHERSSKLRLKWLRYGCTNKRGPWFRLWFRKSVAALRDVNIYMRGMYFVDRKMVLSLLAIMIDQTVAFLVLNS